MSQPAATAESLAARPEWTRARRIVVKIGSALLADRETGTLKTQWLASLMEDVAELVRQGKDVVLWSSADVPDAGQGIFDYMTDSLIERWTKEKVLLPRTATQCAIPKGIFAGPGEAGREGGGGRRMVAVGVGAADGDDPCLADPLDERGDMVGIVRAGIDHRQFALAAHEVALRASVGEGRRIARQHPAHEGCDRLGPGVGNVDGRLVCICVHGNDMGCARADVEPRQ